MTVSCAYPIEIEVPVPTGKVKWFDVEKGFGFVSREDGGDVFLPKGALPAGMSEIKPGTRIEFGVAEGRRGEQALSVRVIEAPPTLAATNASAPAAGTRKPADELVVVVEDTIKVLENVKRGLERGRYPDRAAGRKLAELMRGVARELEG